MSENPYGGPSFDKPTTPPQPPPGRPYGPGGYGHPPTGPGQQGQQSYPPQTGGYGVPSAPYGMSAPPPSGDDLRGTGKGFVAALFDFGFTTFVTPKIIKAVYVLLTVLIGLGFLLILLSAFPQSFVLGLVVLIIGPLVALLYLALIRIGLEFYMAVFRMSDDIQALRHQQGVVAR